MKFPTDPPPCSTAATSTVTDPVFIDPDRPSTSPVDRLVTAVLGQSPHPPSVRLRLLRSGLAEVVDVDGVPTLVVDPVFEMARTAALAGLADADAFDVTSTAN